ncbi:hypothetical protein [Paenibacillus sp. YN15]|uniref:hypothetical protein n=1 Tax=Paenibacillus sp. YN15 TaxID=1742774 RepID=UPI000DCD7342|nr:hypothetical protein [Paenibacillus sp. YN15]RAU96393.1 hypothetical protein DQG13_20800 [Paenibacillus sp. YN15]
MEALFLKMLKKWLAALSAVACIAVIAACAASPTVKEPPKETESLYGSYRFEKQIYMNPLSSFMAFEGFEEYYTFTENSLIITDTAGNQRKVATAGEWQQSTVDEQEFKNSLIMKSSDIPELASYKERKQYTLTAPSAVPAYRLYVLDDEIWLARLQANTANIQQSVYFWSIFKLARLDERIPVKAAIAGTRDNVDAFLSLQQDFKSGSDRDTCYNITPEYIKENSDYRIFKYDTSAASFLLYKDKVYPLGQWLGGFGLTSMALADLDGDGRQELYFTYSWGSGLHRSHAAYFDPAAKQVITLEYIRMDGDMVLADNYDGSLSVFDATLSSRRGFVDFDIAGTGLIADIVYANGKISLKSGS